MQKAHQWLYKHNVGVQKIHTYGAFTVASNLDYDSKLSRFLTVKTKA
ncbi:MAG: hypothetical protein IKT96_06095 [Paludibacteraceae bacterium]|nr:hypothetical protein [Paludibacteraceae bacterium]